MVKWLKSCLVDQCQPEEVECRRQDFTESTGELLRSANPTHPDLLSQLGQGLGITILNRSPDDSQAHSQVCIFRPDFLPEFWTCVSKNPLNISTWMLAPNGILYRPQTSSSFSKWYHHPSRCLAKIQVGFLFPPNPLLALPLKEIIILPLPTIATPTKPSLNHHLSSGLLLLPPQSPCLHSCLLFLLLRAAGLLIFVTFQQHLTAWTTDPKFFILASKTSIWFLTTSVHGSLSDSPCASCSGFSFIL